MSGFSEDPEVETSDITSPSETDADAIVSEEEVTPEAREEASSSEEAEAQAAEDSEEVAEKRPRRRARRRKAEEPVAEAEAEEPVAEDAEAEEPVAEDEAEEPEDEAEEPEAEAEDVVVEKPAPRRTRSRRQAEPEAPAKVERPSRRRESSDRPVARPVVRAQAKYVKSSARKARLVCDNIRGKSVEEARAILAHTPRAVARDWSKLLESAVANAEHNHELVGEDLYVKAVHADEGPTGKRFRPRAMGRATRIRKRTAHLTILLTPKD